MDKIYLKKAFLKTVFLSLFAFSFANFSWSQCALNSSLLTPTCKGRSDGQITATATGTGPFTFTLNGILPGNSTGIFSGLAAGMYTVAVRDANNCTRSLIVNVPDGIEVTTDYVPENACFGEANGAAFVVGFNGVEPYTYRWDANANNQTVQKARNLRAGAYSVTVTDQNGCFAVENVDVLENPELRLTPSSVNTSCSSAALGSVSVTTTGGIPGYSYAWNDAANTKTQTVNNLRAGNYTVTVTDSYGCKKTASTQVLATTTVRVSGTPKEVSCYNGNDGEIRATVSGGSGPYTYQIGSTTNSTGIFTNLITGNFRVQVTDRNGCTGDTLIGVTQPLPFVPRATVIQNGGCSGYEGELVVYVDGGTRPYSYIWSNNSRDTFQGGLTPGTYIVTVTDAKNCQIKDTVVLTGLPPFQVVGGTTPNCQGQQVGHAYVGVSGGLPPYQVLWDQYTGFQQNDTAYNLSAGLYYYTVTDHQGCEIKSSVFVEIFPPMSLSATATFSDCANNRNGTATVTASGGNPGYEYFWDDPLRQNTQTAQWLSSGTYTVSVVDESGCIATKTVEVTAAPQFDLSIQTLHIACSAAGNRGAIIVETLGGSPPFSYRLNGSTNSTGIFDKLAPGFYDIVVTDSTGCTMTDRVEIYISASMIVDTRALTNAGCTDREGSGEVIITGGTPPYQITWSNGLSGISIGGLASGTYTVTVIDDAGCEGIGVLVIEPRQPIDLTATTKMACFGVNNGSATVTASNGVTPYTYRWSANARGQTTPNIINVNGGTFFVTVTDKDLCQSILQIDIPENPEIVLAANAQPTDCTGGNSGTVSVTARGGTGVFQYLWNDPANSVTPTVTNLSPGTYSVTVTDGFGCNATANTTVISPTPIDLAGFQIADVTCFGEATGSATVRYSGGNGNISFLWNDPNRQTTVTASNLRAGNYSVTLRDDVGCVANGSIQITEPEALLVQQTVTDIACGGQLSGAIELTVSGGILPYTFQWNDNVDTEDRANLPTGNYSLTLTDGNQCVQNLTFAVKETAPISIVLAATDIQCFDYKNGSIKAVVNGGTPPYQYVWSNGTTTDLLTDLPAGIYTLTLTDARNCEFVETIEITQPAPFKTDLITEDVTCHGDMDGFLAINPSGGTPPYLYQLNDGEFSGNNIYQNLPAGRYHIVILDSKQCQIDTVAFIVEPEAFLLSMEFDTVVRLGDSIILKPIVTGPGLLTFEWFSTDLSTMSCTDCLQPLVKTYNSDTYELVVTNETGCKISGRTIVFVDKSKRVYFPSAFSPNHDGINDLFTGYADHTVEEFESLQVFDRWGNFVFKRENFQPNDESLGWDGIYRGKPMDSGVFVFFAEVKFIDGSVEIFKGDVTLVR